jgi:hypothetical protein
MYDLLCVIIFVTHWQYNDDYTKKVILVRDFHAGLNKWELTKRNVNVVIDILRPSGHRAHNLLSSESLGRWEGGGKPQL